MTLSDRYPPSSKDQFIHPPDSRSSSPISYIDDDDSDVERDGSQGTRPNPSEKENNRSRPKPTASSILKTAVCCTKDGCVLKDIPSTKLLPPHHRHGSDNSAIITLPSVEQRPNRSSMSSGFSRLPQLDEDTPVKNDSQGTASQTNGMRNRNQSSDGRDNSHHKSDPSGASTLVPNGGDEPPVTFPAVVKAVRHSEHPTHEGRSLVLCFDGTGDQFDGDNSNVVKYFACLRKNDKRRQLVYYQAGIGTYLYTQYTVPGMKTLSKIADLAVAHSISTHIKGGYHFLQENFTIGDRIILLGFSRGAYTARALAGMLHKVGLLAKGNMEQVPFAYKLYKDSSSQGFSMSREFKRTFSMDVRVHFMGCWDSVSSVGFFRTGSSFPFDSGDRTVTYFRHAMALDERRAKFKVGRWERFEAMMERLKKKGEEKVKNMAGDVSDTVSAVTNTLGGGENDSRPRETEAPPGKLRDSGISMETKDSDSGAGEVGSGDGKGKSTADRSSSTGVHFPSYSMADSTTFKNVGSSHNLRRKKEDSTTEDMDDNIFRLGHRLSEWGREEESIEAELAAAEEPESMVKPRNQVSEVWFPGAHCDVGGGAVRNEIAHSLSKIPLRWMIRQTFKCNTGIVYDSASLAALGMDLTSLYPFVKKRKEMILEPPSDLPHIVPSTDKPSDLGSSSGMGGSSFEESRPEPNEVDLGKGKKYELMTEEEHDYVDSLQGINDELSKRKGWYLLEVLPVAQENYHPPTGTWFKTMGPNLGRHRVILDNRPKLHRSLITRQKKLGYSLKALNTKDGRDVKVRYME